MLPISFPAGLATTSVPHSFLSARRNLKNQFVRKKISRRFTSHFSTAIQVSSNRDFYFLALGRFARVTGQNHTSVVRIRLSEVNARQLFILRFPIIEDTALRSLPTPPELESVIPPPASRVHRSIRKPHSMALLPALEFLSMSLFLALAFSRGFFANRKPYDALFVI